LKGTPSASGLGSHPVAQSSPRLRSWGHCVACAFSTLVVLVINLADPVVAEAGLELDGTLYFVWWRVGIWGQDAAGSACWLSGEADALRIEIGRRDAVAGASDDQENTLAQLLSRRGEGWTLATPGTGGGTFQAWGERWREANHRLLVWGRVLAAALAWDQESLEVLERIPARRLADSEHAAARPNWLRTAPGANQERNRLRLEVPENPRGETASGGSEVKPGIGEFRDGLQYRGYGRGAPAEILTLLWQPAADPQDRRWVRVTSSRRVGHLDVSVPTRYAVRYPLPESFLTPWSLAEVLERVAGWENEALR